MYLPVVLCSVSLNTTEALKTSYSSSQYLCYDASNIKNRAIVAMANLRAELLASLLNIRASLVLGGKIPKYVNAAVNECQSLCKGGEVITDCVNVLSKWNQDLDTFQQTQLPFSRPGKANPTICNEAQKDNYYPV
jgi:hypothetical protein